MWHSGLHNIPWTEKCSVRLVPFLSAESHYGSQFGSHCGVSIFLEVASSPLALRWSLSALRWSGRGPMEALWTWGEIESLSSKPMGFSDHPVPSRYMFQPPGNPRKLPPSPWECLRPSREHPGHGARALFCLIVHSVNTATLSGTPSHKVQY